MIFSFVRMHVFLKDKNIHISINIHDNSCGQLFIKSILFLLSDLYIDSLVIVNSLKIYFLQAIQFHDSLQEFSL